MTEEQLRNLKRIAKDWLEMSDMNIDRNVVHCSFPYRCECCAERELKSFLRDLVGVDGWSTW